MDCDLVDDVEDAVKPDIVTEADKVRSDRIVIIVVL